MADRVYAPEADYKPQPLYALESKRSIKDFDAVGFSIQYELAYPTILKMLDMAGIPYKNSDRNDEHPIILAGGPPESADELVYLDELRNPAIGANKERLNRTFALKGSLPNPAIMAASTFFMGPSDYEPCGLIQGECFGKGTPVIATDVGGFHDTITDGETGFLAKYPNENEVYNKLVEALKMYFYEPEKYKQMVANDLKVDFSWNQPGKKGSIFEYTDKLGFDRDELPEVAA